MKKECHTCMGLGIIPVMRPPMPCPDCNGLGYIEIEDEEPEICSCGHIPSVLFTALDGWFVRCGNCGRTGDNSCDKNEALIGWHIELNKEC